MQDIKVGVIGGGIYGTYHLRALTQLQLEGKVSLQALSDIKEEILEKNRRKFHVNIYKDYKEMILKEKLDAVTIATPDHLHKDIVLDCIESKLNILVEKPLDITVSGCEEILKASKKRNILVMVDFHKRYDPDHKLLENLISSGKMGNILYGYAWCEDRIDVPTEWFNWSSNTSPALFLGTHFYDLFRWLMKCEPRKVYANGQKKYLKSIGIDMYDYIQTFVEFENNAHIFFSNSMILPKEFPSIVNQGLRVIGTKGIWENDTQNRGVEFCLSGEGMIIPNNIFYSEGKNIFNSKKIYSGYSVEGLRNFINAVIHLKEGGKMKDISSSIIPNAYDGLQATKVANAAHESIRNGKIVQV